MIIQYNILAIIFIIIALSGSLILLAFKQKYLKNIALFLLSISVIISGFYIAELWIFLERIPLRTLGETRLWYTFFIETVGLIIFLRWRIKIIPLLSSLFASLFVITNLLSPENFDKTLMPALQSLWFAPHVIVYIFAYSLLGISVLFAVIGYFSKNNNKSEDDIFFMADNTVYLGFSFLSFGLIFGALWAKEAWGNYWTWDPKETWALLTWLVYLIYIHYRIKYKYNKKTSFGILIIAFIILIICWFGINYLPAAQNSIHVYS